MAKSTGFMEYQRQDPRKQPVEQRIQHFDEFEQPLSKSELQDQAARCMDCGVPTCHSYGCPVENRVPDWNDAVYGGQWRRVIVTEPVTARRPFSWSVTSPVRSPGAIRSCW